MSGKKIVIVGGGLWGGLLAFRLSLLKPHLDFELIERGQSLGGIHTWSFHESDINEDQRSWIKPLVTKSWPSYQVRFPSYEKEIQLKYCSIISRQFNDVILNSLPPERVHLGKEFNFKEVDHRSHLIIDASGSQIQKTGSGYQKFFGMHLRLKKPHGRNLPSLMDAAVPQKESFRFYYLLPWGEREMLIEDTYYSDSPDLDTDSVREEIRTYLLNNNWEIDEVLSEEKGVLTIPLNELETPPDDGILHLSNIYHDVTGYSLPDAVKVADLLAGRSPEEWPETLFNYRHQQSGRRRFYRMLNRLMFRSCEPQERYKMLEYFYRSSSSSVAKFYGGNMNTWDKAAFFAGKPPVSILKALPIMLGYGREKELVK